MHVNPTEAATHHRFKLIDSVFSSFIETNDHCSITYLATLFLKDGHNGNWLSIKLNNDEFYIPKRGQMLSTRNNTDNWILLENTDWADLKQLRTLFRSVDTADSVPIYSSARFFWREGRMDLEIYSNDLATYPHVLVTFERGSPYFDEDVESSPL
jgi:hypothetical protein